MKRKDRTAEKAAADPQAVQRGRLRSAAPFGLVFRVVLVAVSRRVLGCGARQRGALVYAKHTLRCHFRKFTRFGGNIKYIDRLIQWLENYIRP